MLVVGGKAFGLNFQQSRMEQSIAQIQEWLAKAGFQEHCDKFKRYALSIQLILIFNSYRDTYMKKKSLRYEPNVELHMGRTQCKLGKFLV